METNTLIASISLILALTIVLIAIRNSKIPGAASVILLSFSIAIWSSSSLLQDFPFTGLDGFQMAALLFSITVAASAQLTFSLSYTNRPAWFTRYSLALLVILPVVTQILYWVKPWHAALFTGPNSLVTYPAFSGPWGTFNIFYIYNLVGASVLLLLDRFIRKPRLLLFSSWTIWAGSLAPFTVLTLGIIGIDPFMRVEPALLAFTFTALGFSYGLFSRRLVEVVPVTREAVVEEMDDGWVVLDTRNIIVDINPAAERIIGLSRDEVYGQPIVSILGDLPSLVPTFDGNREFEMKRSVRSEEGWRYLNIRISSLADHRQKDFGRLITWRDITERKLAEDARQRARDEMFVLINAISSAASNATDLDEFLSESIYHIVYPFRSQIVEIYLLDERDAKNDEPNLFLASHFGLSTDEVDEMSVMSISSPLFDWVARNRQSLLVEDLMNDSRIPPAVRKLALTCFLAVPLVTQTGESSKVIGFMCMARREKPIFSQDEIVRLTTISDHIATLIDSDRRRKLAIALTERQKLMRDLHDSVSQKLYGLVTLTEAAQAGLEAGSTVNPSQVLTRIGENARQAVKEMRLFLYQMQPIDVEKDGLVSVLHHRLAAVEGRADIKARLLADDDIFLSRDKEIALYYIAQEALNNVLRHGRAKSVSVTLKQGRQNVILEILDDGRGFDPKKVDGGGLGLLNMKERALQINGKLKIVSRPDEGTKILVTVRKDQSAAIHPKGKPAKRRQST